MTEVRLVGRFVVLSWIYAMETDYSYIHKRYLAHFCDRCVASII